MDSAFMIWRRRLIGGAFLIMVAVWLSTAIIFVDETEAVLVERFGRIAAIYDRPADRGLHVKLPWPLDIARQFDSRVQLFDPVGRELLTRDRKNVTLDMWVCWRVAEPPAETTADDTRPVVRFFRTLGSREVAEARLDSRLRSILAAKFGQVELSELLSAESPEAAPPEDVSRLEALAREVSDAVRSDGQLTEQMGLEIVDFGIKRINFPEGNRLAVFERMKSERQKIADRYRSAGQAESQVIRSQADFKAAAVLAKAEADAQRIRSAAEAAALQVLNAAHSADPEFYRVLRTLDSYREILTPNTTLVLSTSSQLFEILTEGVPTKGAEPRR